MIVSIMMGSSAAYAQQVTATASAKITNQFISTQEIERGSAGKDADQDKTDIQQNYQISEIQRPCDGNANNTTNNDSSTDKDHSKCLIITIDMQ